MGAAITRVQKRDGRIVPFEAAKIVAAVRKAFAATETPIDGAPERVADQVVARIEQRFVGRVPTVEDLQDEAEEALMAQGFPAVAKAYILYRQKHSEIRGAKSLIGVRDDLKLTVNAVKVLERRYLLRDEDGKLAETPLQMLRRVAKAVAAVETAFGGDAAKAEEEYFALMAGLEFLPNSPTLMNAGTSLGQLSACFVLPVDDDMGSIFQAVRDMALIHQSGGGTGFSFSRLRPKGDLVRSTQGIASGPISFMRVFDTATDVIKQGGKRRGANMGILRVDHPDILEFIDAKARNETLTNFNVSVAVTDAYMDAVQRDAEYALINPRTHAEVRRINARQVFESMAASAWASGDPGIVFIDEVNRANPTPEVGAIESTNPCGEMPLLPFESCNLGSINLAKMVVDGKMNWEKLRRTVRLGVRFLDDVIEANHYPIPQIAEMTRGNRKIGLGVMGFADSLLLLGLPYSSEEAEACAERVMGFVQEEARKATQALAKERGRFPNFANSIFNGDVEVRNATVTSVAPTGTISIIAGCSSGIEPLFALSYVRNVMEGMQLLEVNPHFEAVARARGFYTDELMSRVARSGGVQDLDEVPEAVKRVYVTDFDIAPEWHVRMQAAFQRHCDNAVSKTVNMPPDATIDDVRGVFLLAHRLKCKGITVFRYGSKRQQVLYRGNATPEGAADSPFVSAGSEYAGGCPFPACEF